MNGSNQKCPHEEQTLLFLYGEGDDAAGHLNSCPRCQALAEEVRSVRDAAPALVLHEPPAEKISALRAEAARVARSRKPGRTVWTRWRAPVALAASAVIVVAAAWYLLGRQPVTDERAVWIAPVNLGAVESEINQGLDEIGLNSDVLALESADSETATDAAVTVAWVADGSSPTDDGLASSLVAWGFYRDEESLDRMEVALADLESDLGITAGF